MSLTLLRGFSKVVERQVLAWWIAASFVVGGVEEAKEHLMHKSEILDLWSRLEGEETL